MGRFVWAYLALLVVGVTSGCAHPPSSSGVAGSTASISPRYVVSGEPTSGTAAVSTPTPDDVASATAAMGRVLTAPHLVSGAWPDDAISWRVPIEWWDAHRVRPFKVIWLSWRVPGDGFDRGFIVAGQDAPDSPWREIAFGYGKRYWRSR